MAFPLPTGIVAGNAGHVSHHNDIHAALNDAVDGSFDIVGAKAGTFAARPATGNPGQIYLAIDTGRFYIWDGSSWAVTDGEVVNVLDFGAVGDGVTNNATTLQAAIDATPTGGTVVFPQNASNDYLTNSTLTRATGIRIVAESGVTVSAPAGVDILDFAMSNDNELLQIDGLNLSGGLGAITVSSGGPTNYINQQSYIRDLDISGPATYGIKATVALISIEFLSNVNVENPGTYGLWAEAASNTSNAVVINKFRCASADTAAVYINNTGAASNDTSWTFINPIIEANLGKGFHFNQTRALLINPYFELNGQTAGAADIHLSHTGASSPHTDVSVLGGWFAGTGHANQAGIRIQFDSTFCRLKLDSVNGNNGNKIDGGGHSSGAAVHIAHDYIFWTIQNMGGAVSLFGTGNSTLSGVLCLKEGAGGTPGSDEAYLYAEDNGSGKTRVMAKFASGAAQQVAIQP